MPVVIPETSHGGPRTSDALALLDFDLLRLKNMGTPPSASYKDLFYLMWTYFNVKKTASLRVALK